MKALAKTQPACELICDSKVDRAAWLKERMNGFGCSEAYNVHKRHFLKLYARKTGALAELEQTERMKWGHKLERLVGEEYLEMTGRRAIEDGCLYRSTRYPWALATLDWLTEIDGELVPLEIKCVGSEWAHEWENGPPERYWWQCQTEQLVWGSRKSSIIAFIGGNRFAWCDIARDDAALEHYVRTAEEAWSYIERREVPPSDPSESAREALAALYPKDDGAEVFLPGEFLDHDAELIDIKDRQKALEKRRRELENLIKRAIGDASKAWLQDGTGYSLKAQTVAEHTVKESTFRVLRRHASKER